MREVLILYKHTHKKKKNTIKMHRFFAILLKEKSIQNKKKDRNLSTALTRLDRPQDTKDKQEREKLRPERFSLFLTIKDKANEFIGQNEHVSCQYFE